VNKEEKAAAVEEIAQRLGEAEAIFAVDYRGISVTEAAELRSSLREADATFRVVKNRLAKRAAEQAGTNELQDLLDGVSDRVVIAVTFLAMLELMKRREIVVDQAANGRTTFKNAGRTRRSGAELFADGPLGAGEIEMGQFGNVAGPEDDEGLAHSGFLTRMVNS